MAKYELREQGYTFDTVEADSAERALDDCDPSAGGDYDTTGGTVWTEIYAINVDDSDDRASRTYQIDPREPDCEEDEHDWQSPAFLGGCRENPGVIGHGGGVLITECCMRCGCRRSTDTWAQNPSTGEQGLESVSYEPGAYSEEIAR